MNKTIRSSEWVSIGHPDKMADAITSYILDRYIEVDPNVRYAVECLLKCNTAILAGEVTSNFKFSTEQLKQFVENALNLIGYTPEYRSKWGLVGEDVNFSTYISEQSPDISKGVSNGGWGDQGIFWGMATNDDSHDNLHYDRWLASSIGKALYERRIGGVDIKTLVTTADDKVENVIVAIPTNQTKEDIKEEVESTILEFCKPEKIVVNGTGSYVLHGPWADTGVTGRKLAVDFYGGNCRIGGGCPWGKDASKADVTLNVYARKLAVEFIKENQLDEVYVSIACCIGRPEILVCYYDKLNRLIKSESQCRSPNSIVAELGLDKPVYFKRCMEGLW